MNAVLTKPLATNSNQPLNISSAVSIKDQVSHKLCVSASEQPTVLADIYKSDINIAIWQRKFDADLTSAIGEFIASNPNFSKSISLSPDNAFEKLEFATDGTASKALLENMA